jgi:alpha-beta hydrolase superfamily lysophospholipase
VQNAHLNHYPSVLLRRPDGHVWGKESRGRFTVTPTPAGAVVFVHGFRSAATEGWRDFPSVLPREPKAADYDLLFFGYDTREQAAGSAILLREFLRAIAEAPAQLIANPSLPADQRPRAIGMRYRHIVVAAHSLGAVVTRLALLQLESAPRTPLDWLSKVRLVLYAPAHSGALAVNLASLLFLGLPVVGTALLALARKRYRSINDLDPSGHTLQEMRQATRELLDSGPRSVVDCHRAWPLHASREWVVRVASFLEDKPLERYEGADHLSVCKPTPSRARPLEFLLSAMP